MAYGPVAVLTTDRQTRRQVARSLRAGGMRVTFLESPEQVDRVLGSGSHRLLIVDCETSEPKTFEVALAALAKLDTLDTPTFLILLALQPDRSPLVQLLKTYDIAHLVAKHSAVRVAKTNATRPDYAMLDEHELLVTCEKALTGDIFGLEKYLGGWGVMVHRRTIKAMSDKVPFLDELERYVRDLELPQAVVPDIVTVAEELILNAMVHAPRDAYEKPKYEHLGPSPDLTLEPQEYVSVAYGCDGRRLLLSVTDNFGTLDRRTLYEYLRRGFRASLEPDTKPSGAGLGLSLSLRAIHQLVINVRDSRRTEVIAGWYLRIQSGAEFKQVGKSINLFYAAQDSVPAVEDAPSAVAQLRGRIDENFDFREAVGARLIDLRNVTTVTSRGLTHWIEFIRTLKGRNAELIAFPEFFVFQATTVNGVVEGVSIRTVLAPFECTACQAEERRELPPEDVLRVTGVCSQCGMTTRFAGLVAEFQAFLETLRS
jgi:hypothetical protein